MAKSPLARDRGFRTRRGSGDNRRLPADTPPRRPTRLLPNAPGVAIVLTLNVSIEQHLSPESLDFCEFRGGTLTAEPTSVSSLNASRSVEVFVVDTPRAANVALGVARADAESTHVLCRHRDESTPDFTRRV